MRTAVGQREELAGEIEHDDGAAVGVTSLRPPGGISLAAATTCFFGHSPVSRTRCARTILIFHSRYSACARCSEVDLCRALFVVSSVGGSEDERIVEIPVRVVGLENMMRSMPIQFITSIR